MNGKKLRFWKDEKYKIISMTAMQWSFPGYKEETIQRTIGAFLGTSVISVVECKSWINSIDVSYGFSKFYAESTLTTCIFTISSNDKDGTADVKIENYHTDEIVNLNLLDMKIILEKWLEFLENGEPIEYSWETPVKNYIYDESIDAYVPAPE